jgi:hypothetical protein
MDCERIPCAGRCGLQREELKNASSATVYIPSPTPSKVSAPNLCTPYQVLYPFVMATVDMNSVQFYEPRLNPPFHHQFRRKPPQTPTQNRHVISSVTEALSVPEKLDRGLGSSGQLGYSIEAKPNRRENVSSQPERNKDDVVGSHGTIKESILRFLLIS